MNKKATAIFCMIMAIVLLIIGTVFIITGFDKKDNYYNGDLFNTNSYVGGDAYNFIINAGYFTGYLVLGSALYICAALFFCINFYLRSKASETPSNYHGYYTKEMS